MALRNHEIEMVDEIAAKVVSELRDSGLSSGGDSKHGLDWSIPGGMAGTSYALVGGAQPVSGSGTEQTREVLAAELRRRVRVTDKLKQENAELTEALEESNAALKAMAKRLADTEAAAHVLCGHADETVRELLASGVCAISPEPLHRIGPALLVKLRKIQQHCDALERLMT